MAALPDEVYAAALGRAYNAWLAEEWVSRADGLYGAVVAAPHDPEDAAREIRRYGALDEFVGVYLPTAGVNPLWGSRRYTPIFEAAAEMRLPVMLHSVGLIHAAFPFNVEQFRTILFRHPIQHEFALMANMFSMLEAAVPVRFPELRIVFTEGGISWVPFTMWRLDKEYHEYRSLAPLLEHPPSHYIRTVLLLDPADRGARASPGPGDDARHVRRRRPGHVRIRLAPPRLRSSAPGAQHAVPGGGEAEDHGRERAGAVRHRRACARRLAPMARIHAGTSDALAPGERTFVKHRNVEIGVFNVNGEFRAYRNRCPHQLGPACEGAISGTLMGSAENDWNLEWVLDGRVLLCPWHQVEFDLDTGERIRGLGERLRSYTVEVDDGELYVNV